jgi:hypothetical protein
MLHAFDTRGTYLVSWKFTQNAYSWGNGIFMPFFLTESDFFVNAYHMPHCALVHYWCRLFSGTRNTLYLHWTCVVVVGCLHYAFEIALLAYAGDMWFHQALDMGTDWDVFSISSLWISSFTTMGHFSFRSFTVTNNIWWHESYECYSYHQMMFAWSIGWCHLFALTTNFVLLSLYHGSVCSMRVTLLPRGWRQKVFRNVSIYQPDYVTPRPRRENTSKSPA